MIPPDRVELVEYIIDASNAVEILSDGIKRDKRGSLRIAVKENHYDD